MALKTLKNKYDELLKVFGDVGVTLTESQKNSLDTFMLDFQAKLDETRDNAVKVTKKLVEQKMEKEFREVFESIRKNQQEVYEKAGKIDNLKFQKFLTEAVDRYLSEYVEEILPHKSIVDYSRMQKLEQIQESLKGMLLVNDEAVEKKVDELKMQLESKASAEKAELKDKLEKCEKVVEESRKQNEELSKKYASLAKKDLIGEKTKNLPIIESRKVKERLSKMTVEEIEKNYKTVVESVREEMQDEQDKIQEEKNLEEAIADLLEGDGSSEKTGDDEDKGTESNPEPAEKEEDAGSSDSEEDDEESPVTESVARAYMRQWIDTLARITPKK